MGNCLSADAGGASSSEVRHAPKSTRSSRAPGGKPVPQRIPKPKPAIVKQTAAKSTGKGHKLADSLSGAENSDEKLDPREAARKAAQERFEESRNKNTGKLSKQLENERSKSTRTHLEEHSKQKIDEKLVKQNQLNYD